MCSVSHRSSHMWTTRILIALALHVLRLADCDAACYFSAELQGEYVMQTVMVAGSGVQYATVNVTAEAIPVWGQCHQRLGDNVILNDSFNGTACIRCFHLKLHSPNVLQVHTCPSCLDKCYFTEEAAKNTCLTPEDFAQNKHKEITLFRTKEIGGASIRKMYCPITGHYSFTYNLFNQTDNRVECSPAPSQLENCPDVTGGPRLDVHFNGCSQQYNAMSFECLGDWPGPAGQRFLALYDTGITASSEHRPQYRCALYNEDVQRGNVMLALSSDSTCSTDLYNASYGYMTWNLTVSPSKPWPANVATSKCSFPAWSQGKWEHFSVNYNSLMYKDHMSYNSYFMRCSQKINDEKFIVFSKNGCGEEVYKCIQLQHRSGNVLEFQIGLSSSLTYNSTLCSENNFIGNVWVTQARLEGLQVSPCPVTGEYSGMIPNAHGLCARLASDPLRQEIMYFTVSDCEQQEVYEGQYLSRRFKRQLQEDISILSTQSTSDIAIGESKPVGIVDISKSEPISTTGTATVISTVEETTVLDPIKKDFVTQAVTESPTSEMPREITTQTVPLFTEEIRLTESYPTQNSQNYNDSEQVESSLNVKTDNVDSHTIFLVSYNDSAMMNMNRSNAVTNRPYRSFQPVPINPWAPSPWAQMYPSTTPSWYYIHNNRNMSSPQMTSRTKYLEQFPHASDGSYNRGMTTDYPARGYFTDSYYTGITGGGYDRRDWASRGRQFGNVNTSSYNIRNYWTTATPRDGYVNQPWPRTSDGYPYQKNPVPSRNIFNVTTVPGDSRGGDWRYQNSRPNWNWDSRYRNPMSIPYRPYQNTNPNYKQPIALPPIQLPPLPVQGASRVGHPPFVREEREYQCLGQWEEDGVTYTYTQRKDFGTYECFVGSIVSNNEIYIKEAGEHCGRGIDPLQLGMKLQTRGLVSVATKPVDPNPPTTKPMTSWYVTKRPASPTKPWKPITGAPPKHSGLSKIIPSGLLITLAFVISFLRC